MSLVFPNNPTIGDVFQGFVWDGQSWNRIVRAATGGGGTIAGQSVILESQYAAGNVAVVRNAWVDVGTVTIPQRQLGGRLAILFDGTADRTNGAGTLSVRLMRGSTLIRSEVEEVEVSAQAEHEQIVMMATDTPPADADAVYTVQVTHDSNLVGTVHARELLVIGGTAAGGGGVSQEDFDAEKALRVAGDDIQATTASTATELTDELDAQENLDTALLIDITGTFTSAGTTYNTGDILYVPPGSRDIERLFNAATRDYVDEARKLANENKTRIDAIPVYAATMTVNPPNVAGHSNFQRKFQSALSGLDPRLATNAGSTGTRFTNTFRIFTRLSDGTVVQLHTQGWSFTNDARQSIGWDVSATEFNALGSTSATTGIEVWGEFRAVYGGGVNEFRGRTNPVFIDFGEEDEWPATRGELTAVEKAIPNVAPFSTIQVLPEGAADDTIPAEFDVKFSDRQTTKAITGVTLGIAGQPAVLKGTTPISNIATRDNGVLSFTFTDLQRGTIRGNIEATDESIAVDIVITFSDSTVWRHGEAFFVHNANFAGGGSAPTKAQIDALKVNADTVDNFHIVSVTAAQYAAITTKDSKTIYLVDA